MEESAIYFRDVLLIRILSVLGCRISEAVGIEVKHIDFKNKTVAIKNKKVRITLWCPYCMESDNKVRLTKKAKFCPICGKNVLEAAENFKNELECRYLPVDQETLEIIKEYIDRGGPVKTKDGRTILFGITRQYAWWVIKDCAERAGLGRINPRKIRNAFAIASANEDSSINSLNNLQNQLGYKNISSTLRYRK